MPATSGAAPVAAVERLTTLELDALPRDRVVHECLGHAGLVEEGLVEHAHSAARDGAHGELALPREAELPDDEHVERRIEPAGDLTTDDDAATR